MLQKVRDEKQKAIRRGKHIAQEKNGEQMLKIIFIYRHSTT